MWSCQYCGRINGNRWKACCRCRVSKNTGRKHPFRDKECSIEGCTGRHSARGMCVAHYRIWYYKRRG